MSNKGFWVPTKPEKARAETVGRAYGEKELALKPDQLEAMIMDANPTGYYMNDMRVLLMQFYDPRVLHPDPHGVLPALRGGFPYYFTVTVDVSAWKVIRHYAEPL